MFKSANYAPSSDLNAVIARHYVFSIELPEHAQIVDNLLSETAFLRILLRGDWAAETAADQWSTFGPMVLSGASSRPLRVRVRGPFDVVGLAFRPAGWRALFDQSADVLTDRIMPFGDAWGDAESTALFNAVAACAVDDHGAIINAVEFAVRRRMAQRRSVAVDAALLAFELIARNDSTMPVATVADMLGMSQRQLERACATHFGMSPKTVLRRSRFLDMATAMRGLSTPSEEELAALRYADQSHLNREFRRFFGMTPGQFAAAQTPLFTAGLQLRMLRKRDDMASRRWPVETRAVDQWAGL